MSAARAASAGTLESSSAPGPTPFTSAISSSAVNWMSQASTRVARSSPHKPGITRRAGRTMKSVSAVTNWETGLR
ncbi:hypothetical protein D3C83_104940 [compost metagenome]